MNRKSIRGFPLLIIGILIVFGLSNCTVPAGSPGSGGGTVQIEWVDFIQFGGIHYLAQGMRGSSQPGLIREEGLGTVYSTVKFKVAGNVSDPGYQIKDGDAAFLDVGTKLYTVKGYQPWFRLAAHSHGSIILYEVDRNPKAKRGADLLDVDGKIQYIGVNSEQDSVTELARIKDRQEIVTLSAMIKNAPISTRRSNQMATYFLALHLVDGTTCTRQYWADPDNLFGYLTMPKAFQTAIERAVHP